LTISAPLHRVHGLLLHIPDLGISFLQERTSGTLEKLLSTPIKRWEIVTGYIFGFGIITVIQSAIITFYVIMSWTL
jgi:ABC-type Na+ efflux pump permease subunit